MELRAGSQKAHGRELTRKQMLDKSFIDLLLARGLCSAVFSLYAPCSLLPAL